MIKILIDPKTVNGNPHIEGTRITVLDVVADCKYYGVKETIKDLKSEIVFFGNDDLLIILNYCSHKKCCADNAHCGGCELRCLQDEIHTSKQFIDRFDKVIFEESDQVIDGAGREGGVMILPGTPDEIEKYWKGEKGWEIAGELLGSLKNSVSDKF